MSYTAGWEAAGENEPQLERARLERTRDLMDRHARGSLNILAAAIVGRCDVIVTKNLRDFPAEILAEYGIGAQHPDEFLLNQLNPHRRCFARSCERSGDRCRIRHERLRNTW